MPKSRDEIVEQILSKKIDKQEAMRSFEGLTEAERSDLVDKLRSRLSGRDGGARGGAGKAVLKPVDERDLTDGHKEFIRKLIGDYGKMVPKSMAILMEYQDTFVDQRRPFHLIKELKNAHFQITYEKADGAYVHDIDGNRYVDISGDMGVNIFGHRPEFIVRAIKDGIDQGIPIAGYSPTIFKTARLFCDITGHERMLFTQSGTEAVMFAVRIARAATQKKKIVIFDGSFHGLSDAVIAMKGKEGKSLSMGPGMLQEFADQLIVLEYGNPRDLDEIERRADEIAGVLVEPVQSRHPYKQPGEFLRDLRRLTLEKQIPLIIDEMITGFRICPRGAQGYFGVKADIATYGKIPGGGMPTGIVAGAAKYLDLVDGGAWRFGDESMPKSLRTGMAGTHTQNPLKVAASYALLSEIKKSCPDSGSCETCNCFQKDLNEKTRLLAENLNAFFREKGLAIVLDHFGSLFRFRFVDSFWGITEALLYILLRMNGIETNIQGNCFLTTAHTQDDIDTVIRVVKANLDTLIGNGFFREAPAPEAGTAAETKPGAPAKAGPTQSVRSKAAEAPAGPAETAVGGAGWEKLEKLRSLLKADLQRFATIGNGD